MFQTTYRGAAAYLELGKARLSGLVVVTAVVGFVLAGRCGTGQGPFDATVRGIDWLRLAGTAVGVALAALGANALNQWAEVVQDSRMRRTCRRPLPARRLGLPAALAFGLLVGLGGPLMLGLLVDWLAAGLAFATLLVYVLLYTPLKQRTPANTLVGAVVGALPPLVGWAAATGGLDAPAWILGGILFVWQIPHFLALAWMYREDYARGGFRMLPSVDPAGDLTGLLVVLYSLLLLPLTIALALAGVTGSLYTAGAVMLGLGLLLLSVALERQRTTPAARRLFLASVIYLPLLLGLAVADGPPREASSGPREDVAAHVAAAAAASEQRWEPAGVQPA